MGRLVARDQPRARDEIDDSWIRVIDRAGSVIHPRSAMNANQVPRNDSWRI